MANKYRSSKPNCGQEVIDLQKLMGRSSEVIINVDSQTEIQVKLKENKSKICTVVKKSCENITSMRQRDCMPKKNRGMCAISESMSDGSMDMANYQRRNRMSARRQESCMDDLMFAGGRNECSSGFGGERQRRSRMNEMCDDPCKEMNRRTMPRYGTRDMYDNTGSSMRKSAPCDMRGKQDPCKMIRKDPCGGESRRKSYDRCMEDERDFYQRSKGNKYDDRCERMNDVCGRDRKAMRDPCQKKDPCAIQKDLLKKYPCLTMPKDIYGGGFGGGRRESCKMREDPCKMMREDPCKRKDPCKKPKEGPCKPRYQDPCEKKRVCPPKPDPCKPERSSRPSAAFDRYESSTPCPPCPPQDTCIDPCKDPCSGYDETPVSGASKDKFCDDVDSCERGGKGSSKDSCKDNSRGSKDSTTDKNNKDDKKMDDLGLEDAKRKRSSFELGADEEVWIVQCPKTVDLRGLVGAKIKLGASKTSLKVDELSIDCSTHEYPENRTLSLAAGNGKIRKMDTVGAIKIKKKSASNPNITKSPIRAESIKRESSKYSSPEIMSPKRKKSTTQN